MFTVHPLQSQSLAAAIIHTTSLKITVIGLVAQGLCSVVLVNVTETRCNPKSSKAKELLPKKGPLCANSVPIGTDPGTIPVAAASRLADDPQSVRILRSAALR